MSNERDAAENDDRANPDGWCSLQDTIDRLLMFADGTMPIDPTRSASDRADLLAAVGRLEQLQRLLAVIGDPENLRLEGRWFAPADADDPLVQFLNRLADAVGAGPVGGDRS